MTWMTQAAANAIVADRVQIASAPTLTGTDIDNCLLRTQRASVWAPNTTYGYGDRVVGTTRNGFYFIATQPGASGASEPVWLNLYGAWWGARGAAYMPIYGQQFPQTPFLQGVIITDGGVVWQAAAADWSNVYDLDAATYEAWLLKAAKASEMYAVSEDGQTLQRQMIIQHCLDMAQKYKPIVIA